MVFASMTFLWIFLPFTFIIYYIVTLLAPSVLSHENRRALQNFFLLIMSLAFYSFGEPKYILLLIFSVIINYIGGRMIAYYDNGDRHYKHKAKKAVLVLTILINLLILGYYKYFNFFSSAVNDLLNLSLPLKDIVLPIGISFYTFQAMSYVIDLYLGRCDVQKSFIKLLLYISFFPQLIAGPIVRYRDIEEQIDGRRETISKLSEGIVRFSIGLGKKVILANTFAEYADKIFSLPGEARPWWLAWMGTAIYSMQIYYDFSGYSDMAIGLGKMFGFDFAENFRLPYRVFSIREHWRHWHISLSSWFQEYVYIPLGGSRKGKLRTYRNLLIVFLLTGIWHGAGWNFILWGCLHGIYILIERIWLGKQLDKNPIKIINQIYFEIALFLGWVLFRTENIAAAVSYYKSMFSNAEASYSFIEFFGIRCLVLFALGILIGIVIPEDFQLRLREKPAFRVIAVPALLFISIMLLAADSYNPFIYFRF